VLVLVLVPRVQVPLLPARALPLVQVPLLLELLLVLADWALLPRSVVLLFSLVLLQAQRQAAHRAPDCSQRSDDDVKRRPCGAFYFVLVVF